MDRQHRQRLHGRVGRPLTPAGSGDRPATAGAVTRLPRGVYEAELLRLQGELVTMQEWVRAEGARVVVLFEGRDAAGKGGAIKRITEFLNARVVRVAALPVPTERERTQWYFQRSDAEQQRRFRDRLADPMRRWKLSPMDLESVTRWEQYSRAKDEMFAATDIPESPWHVVDAEDKRSARINMIAHLLSTLPYRQVKQPKLRLPARPPSTGYVRAPRDPDQAIPDHAATLP